jgi:hypothetical protein
VTKSNSMFRIWKNEGVKSGLKINWFYLINQSFFVFACKELRKELEYHCTRLIRLFRNTESTWINLNV